MHFLETTIFRQRFEAGVSARWVSGGTAYMTVVACSRADSQAKVLKQEVPNEQEEDQGIQSEQGKTNRGQYHRDRSWVRRVS